MLLRLAAFGDLTDTSKEPVDLRFGGMSTYQGLVPVVFGTNDRRKKKDECSVGERRDVST